MTDEEKAAIFIKRYWGTYTEAFRDETIPRLVKLIQDEREGCAEIACMVKEELSQQPEKLQYGRTQIEVAEYIETEIRARSS